MSHAAEQTFECTANVNGVGSGGLVLHLVLTHHWYDQTESGAKCIEYRAMTDRWRKQIWDRRDRITDIRFARGYTSRTLTRAVVRIDIGPCPIPGWDGDYYRIHFLQNALDEGPDLSKNSNTK